MLYQKLKLGDEIRIIAPSRSLVNLDFNRLAISTTYIFKFARIFLFANIYVSKV